MAACPRRRRKRYDTPNTHLCSIDSRALCREMDVRVERAIVLNPYSRLITACPGPSLSAVLALLRAHARIEEQFGNALDSIHGQALKELMMQLAAAPKARLGRIELAKRLHVSASTVTRMTQPLEKLGMVGRQSDPRDARLAYVVLGCAATLERLAESLFRDRWIATLASLLGRQTAGLPVDLQTLESQQY
jgi:DNA-binding MarR family transcriptional regulator